MKNAASEVNKTTQTKYLAAGIVEYESCVLNWYNYAIFTRPVLIGMTSGKMEK